MLFYNDNTTITIVKRLTFVPGGTKKVKLPSNSQLPFEKDRRKVVVKDRIKIQQKLVPDLIDKMYRRFSILTTISNNEPVGVEV